MAPDNSCFSTKRATKQQYGHFSTDDYNDKKKNISYAKSKFGHHSKNNLWQGAIKVLSEIQMKLFPCSI